MSILVHNFSYYFIFIFIYSLPLKDLKDYVLGVLIKFFCTLKFLKGVSIYMIFSLSRFLRQGFSVQPWLSWNSIYR